MSLPTKDRDRHPILPRPATASRSCCRKPTQEDPNEIRRESPRSDPGWGFSRPRLPSTVSAAVERQRAFGLHGRTISMTLRRTTAALIAGALLRLAAPDRAGAAPTSYTVI